MLVNGVNHNISNKAYHANKTHLSSSALKLILKSPQEFYQRYVLGIHEEPRNKGALAIGTATHFAVLEGHLFDSEVAVYPGPMRRGAAWTAFEKEHAHKTIVTMSEMDKVTAMVEAYKSNPTAVELVSSCLAEHTICANYNGVDIKVRCDGINVEKGIIIDIKTTAYASGTDIFKETLANLAYDLSGYTYAKVSSLVYDKKFDFLFIVLSKLDNQCRVYKMSKNTMLEGKKLFESAIETYKQKILTGDWSDDSLEIEVNNESIEEV
jgi:hypothetical protein